MCVYLLWNPYCEVCIHLRLYLFTQPSAPVPVKMEGRALHLTLAPVMWGGLDCNVKQVYLCMSTRNAFWKILHLMVWSSRVQLAGFRSLQTALSQPYAVDKTLMHLNDKICSKVILCGYRIATAYIQTSIRGDAFLSLLRPPFLLQPLTAVILVLPQMVNTASPVLPTTL